MEKNKARMRTRIRRPRVNPLSGLVLVASLLGCVGAYTLIRAGAASPVAFIEPETGNLTAPAAQINDAGASGGSAIVFGTETGVDNGMPTAATVGPRSAPTRTLTTAQALTELRSTGHLSRVTITGTFGLSGADGTGWVIEDCRIEASLYGVRGYTSGGAFTGTPAQRPVFRYCEVVGGAASSNDGSNSSACVYGNDMIFEHTDVYGCIDGIKAVSRLEVHDSWVHDLDHPDGAHCDTVQIVSGLDSVFTGNRLDSYVGYSSDGSQTPAGDTGNGVLQTGNVSGDISATWEHNWFAGGHYTIRGAGDRDADFNVSYTFRNNRWLRNGTSVALGLTNLPANRYGPTYGDLTTNTIWENNVWDDTNSPVR